MCGVLSLPFPLSVNRAGRACPAVPAALFSGQEMVMWWKLGNSAVCNQKGFWSLPQQLLLDKMQESSHSDTSVTTICVTNKVATLEFLCV